MTDPRVPAPVPASGGEPLLVEFFRTERPDEGWCGDERGDSPEQCAIHVMRAQAKQLKSYRDALERQSEAAHAERTHLLAQLAAAEEQSNDLVAIIDSWVKRGEELDAQLAAAREQLDAIARECEKDIWIGEAGLLVQRIAALAAHQEER